LKADRSSRVGAGRPEPGADADPDPPRRPSAVRYRQPRVPAADPPPPRNARNTSADSGPTLSLEKEKARLKPADLRLTAAPAPTRRTSALEPRMHEAPGAALEEAARRGHAAVVALGVEPVGPRPAVFDDPSLARASRLVVSLASLPVTEHEFTTRHLVPAAKLPGFVVFDAAGNVFDVLSRDAKAPAILDAARKAQAALENVRAAMPPLSGRIAALKAEGDEAGLLALAQSWIRRPYRGIAEIEELRAFAAKLGADRLRGALEAEPSKSIPLLEGVARDFAGTRLEAAALLGLGRAHAAAGRQAESEAAARRVLETFAGDEFQADRSAAQAILRSFRQDAIRKRLEEMERRKKLEAEKDD
jgi:hypothetical protein